MNAEGIEKLVRSQIGDAWDTTNLHGVDLRMALVPPLPITVIERTVINGEIDDRLVEAWIVLVEKPRSGSGYRIVAAADGSAFGLASEGFAEDDHLLLCGWYGDFLTAFCAM